MPFSRAPAEKISAWASKRGWSQIPIVSGFKSVFQADYKCQKPKNDDMQWPVMHVFTKRDGKVFHFWATETMSNHVDTVWPYWNLFDFTPEGGQSGIRRRRDSGGGFWKSII